MPLGLGQGVRPGYSGGAYGPHLLRIASDSIHKKRRAPMQDPGAPTGSRDATPKPIPCDASRSRRFQDKRPASFFAMTPILEIF